MSKRSAFILFGDLPKISPYLDAINDRQLAALVVTGEPGSALERSAAKFVHSPGHGLASIDELTFQRGSDVAGVNERITDWSRRYDLVGVFSAAETFVEAAGLATDLLGLPGTGLRASRVCRNKYLQRIYLPQWSPRCALLTATSAAQVRAKAERWLPVVAKPLALYSSINVRLISDRDGLDEFVSNLPVDGQFLIEERVIGREVSVESIVNHGAPVHASMTLKATNEEGSDRFVEIAHTVPAYGFSAPETRRILDANTAIIDRLAFGTGMTHAEYRITEDGQPILMEIAARPGGDGILALHHLATGASMEAALVATALGEDIRYPKPVRYSRQLYLPHVPGTLADVSVGSDFPAPDWLTETGVWPKPLPAQDNAPPTVHRLMVLKRRGEILNTITESANRAVTVVFDAPTVAGLDALERRLTSSVRIHVDPPAR